MAVFTALAALSQLETLSTMGSTLSLPATARTSSAVRLTHSSLTSIMATRAPAAVSANVMRRPNPMGLPAPVTNATFPSKGLSAISRCLLFRDLSRADRARHRAPRRTLHRRPETYKSAARAGFLACLSGYVFG